jgi:predicted permease
LQRGVPFLAQSVGDLRFAFRQLCASPGFAIAAILTLALAIGANTAVFSLVNGIVLAPLPYPHADHLVIMMESRPNLKKLDITYPDLQDWQRSARSFEQLAAFTWRSYDLASPGSPMHVKGLEVSSGFFSTLGIKFALGRDFSPSDDRLHAAPAAIISNRLWRERFGASPQALGRTMVLEGVNFTIVGVLPPGFYFMSPMDVYTPLTPGEPLYVDDRTVHSIAGLGRVRPEVTIGEAQGELAAIQQNLDREYPTADRDLGVNLLPLKQEIVGDTRGTLLLLLGAVGVVLLIACTNVANLLLARSAARTREFAIRAALGASRARLVRQLLTESLLLALTGGAVGLAVAKIAISLVLAEFSTSLPLTGNVGMNLPVLLFAFGISLAVAILFGLEPARQSARVDVQGSLKAGERGSTRVRSRAQSALVIVQVALTLVLLVGAGLLLRTIRDLWNVNPGFQAQHVITFKVGLSPSVTKTAPDIRIAWRQLLERIRQIPGVEAADFTNIVPLGDHDNGGPFWVGARQSTAMEDAPHALYFETGPDYLKAMQIPLLRGRFFTPADTMGSEPVVAIDSILAQTYFPGQDPVGRSITVAHWHTARIVGVVGHVRHWGLGDPGLYNPSQIYVPFYQIDDLWVPTFSRGLSIAVRTPLDAADLMPAIRKAVYGAGKDQPVYDVQTMREIESQSMASQRLPMILLASFAVLALVLASVGIYGVISYSVSRRIQEIGIRMALGANRPDVLWMVIGQGLRLTVSGLAIGVAAATLLARLLSAFLSLLYGVHATDPVTFLAVSLVLMIAAFLACYFPARRAASIDPMQAVRAE